MKYIIFGLGNFGSSLGAMLTDLGHEVIGVDNDMHKVETHRERITNTICLDATDEFAINTLPLAEADAIIVAIGDDFGGSVMITALLRQKKVKRLITRSTSPVHQSVFEALGIDEILHPEQEAAGRLVKRLSTPNLVDAYLIGKDHQVIEVLVPKRYVGCKVVELDLKGRFRINLITIIKYRSPGCSLSEPFNPGQAIDFVYAGTILEENDVLVLFGRHNDLRNFMGE
ncbi:MAG TPA: TrkA family potassium uptake protein [Bacteroidales bacterium]|nr:TrkA family potassium uptake protein [Bacteroidales bacterium]